MLRRVISSLSTSALQHGQRRNVAYNAATCLNLISSRSSNQSMRLMQSFALKSTFQIPNARFVSTEKAPSTKKMFSDFLQKEISEEARREKKSAPPAGWELKQDGALAVLQRSFKDGIKIELALSVSGSVNAPDLNEEGEEEIDGNRLLDSFPPFQIRLYKPSGRVLELNCVFYSGDQFEDELEEGAEPRVEKDSERKKDEKEKPKTVSFSIESLALKTRGQVQSAQGGRANCMQAPPPDNEYYVSTEVLDEELLDHLYTTLAERGVDNELALALSALSATQEQSLYVNFLRGLREFVNE